MDLFELFKMLSSNDNLKANSWQNPGYSNNFYQTGDKNQRTYYPSDAFPNPQQPSFDSNMISLLMSLLSKGQNPLSGILGTNKNKEENSSQKTGSPSDDILL